MTHNNFSFPRDFIWGAATAAYQIEGATQEDGRGESIWDRFSHTPGTVLNGETGDVASDHYHRFAEDVELMRRLGLKAYRFSISWPRVLPSGKGPVNWKGIDFYDRLVDTLVTAGIEPFVTLFHWDSPQALEDAGGWQNRDICGHFSDYAALMVHRLGDRVRFWSTFNEPGVFAFNGYRTGEHAPGLRDEKVALQVGHHLLVAHGQAVQGMRAARPDIDAGIVLSLWPSEAVSDSQAERDEAEKLWQKDQTWFVDPVLRGHYPAIGWQEYGSRVPEVKPGDMALISQKLDFIGVNYYSRNLIGPSGPINPVPGSEYTEMGWEVNPPAFHRLLARLDKDYKAPPIYITENGAAFRDEVSSDGHVHDERRVSFIREHLVSVHKAITDGVDVRGYFVWSLLDNFEWQYGYSKRFGIVHVDYPTQKRIVKDSGTWYSQAIKWNGFKLATTGDDQPPELAETGKSRGGP